MVSCLSQALKQPAIGKLHCRYCCRRLSRVACDQEPSRYL